MAGRAYRMRKRAEGLDATRERIVEATAALHREQGVAATSYVQIAERAGVGAATVYRHFPTLGSLVEACGATVWEAIRPPLVGTATDPTLFGATVEFCSAQGRVTFDLPAQFWHASGSGSVFKYTQAGSAVDIKVALIKGGRTLKIVSKAVGIPLPGGLGAVGVRVTTGDVRNCALFTASTILKDEPGKYAAHSALAGAIGDCSDASLGCGAP